MDLKLPPVQSQKYKNVFPNCITIDADWSKINIFNLKYKYGSGDDDDGLHKSKLIGQLI